MQTDYKISNNKNNISKSYVKTIKESMTSSPPFHQWVPAISESSRASTTTTTTRTTTTIERTIERTAPIFKTVRYSLKKGKKEYIKEERDVQSDILIIDAKRKITTRFTDISPMEYETQELQIRMDQELVRKRKFSYQGRKNQEYKEEEIKDDENQEEEEPAKKKMCFHSDLVEDLSTVHLIPRVHNIDAWDPTQLGKMISNQNNNCELISSAPFSEIEYNPIQIFCQPEHMKVEEEDEEEEEEEEADTSTSMEDQTIEAPKPKPARKIKKPSNTRYLTPVKQPRLKELRHLTFSPMRNSYKNHYGIYFEYDLNILYPVRVVEVNFNRSNPRVKFHFLGFSQAYDLSEKLKDANYIIFSNNGPPEELVQYFEYLEYLEENDNLKNEDNPILFYKSNYPNTPDLEKFIRTLDPNSKGVVAMKNLKYNHPMENFLGTAQTRRHSTAFGLSDDGTPIKRKRS